MKRKTVDQDGRNPELMSCCFFGVVVGDAVEVSRVGRQKVRSATGRTRWKERSGGKFRFQLGNLRSGCLASKTAENEEVRAWQVEVSVQPQGSRLPRGWLC